MADSEYDFTQSPLSVSQLLYQIATSGISSATLDYIVVSGTEVSIFFTSPLSSGDQTTLANLVAANTGVDLPQNFIQVSASTSTSTNSSSYVTLNSITYSMLPAGTYLVQFTGTFSTNVPLLSNPGLYVSIFANGTQVPVSEMSQTNSSTNAPFNMVTFAQVTIQNYQTIEIRWKNNGAGNTISCTNRILNITQTQGA
jgi:hypothetical protein